MNLGSTIQILLIHYLKMLHGYQQTCTKGYEEYIFSPVWGQSDMKSFIIVYWHLPLIERQLPIKQHGKNSLMIIDFCTFRIVITVATYFHNCKPNVELFGQ